MQAEVWKKVEELYQAALAQPPDKRAAFLAQTCPDDPQLRAEVQSLLEAAPAAGSFLEGSPLSSVEHARPALKPGAKLGHFEIIELIGRGGMGEVYRARDSRLKRDVAIKVLPQSFARDPERIARFEREARAASALNHPNIVSIYDVGHENGIYWIVSELVAGEPLHRFISRGPLPPRQTIEIAAQIAEGLAAAHAGGIVHRDLKPGNVMLTRDGRAKILDFGLAKQRRRAAEVSATLTDNLTETGVVMGTAAYMSPEQVRGNEADPRSDIFSLGVILHEMLSGKRAFQGDSSVEIMNAILKDDPPELPPSVPAPLDRIARRCLEKEPVRRFQSAADIGFALLAVSGAQIVAPSPSASTRPAWRRWIVVTASACLFAAGAYWLGVRTGQPLTTGETTLRRLTIDPGLTTDAVISADGKFVAYASDRDDGNNLDIWMQQIDTGSAVRLTNDPADDYEPAFSPDGTRIAFRSERDGGGIYEIPAVALRGEPRLLVPKGRRPRYSPDGQFLLYFRNDVYGRTPPTQRTRSYQLLVQAISGGATAELGAGCMVANPAVWSPDSRHVLVAALCKQRLGIWLSSRDGKTWEETNLWDAWLRSNLFSRSEFTKAPVLEEWTANPSRLLMPATDSEDGAFAAYMGFLPISADGKRATGAFQKLTYGAGEEAWASASGNGRIVLSTLTLNSHLWGIPVDQYGKSTGEPKQLTNENSPEQEAGLSWDGTQLAFMEWRAGVGELHLKNLVTGGERLLAQEPYHLEGPVFNRAGSVLAYMANPPTDRTEIRRISVAGGAQERMWPQTYPDIGAQQVSQIKDWSPDEDSLLINIVIGGHYGVTIVDRKTARTTGFLADPERDVWEPHFSPDGRWVTFIAARAGHSQLYVAPFRRGLVSQNEWIAIADRKAWDDKPRFSHDGKTVLFISDRDGHDWCVWGQRLNLDMRPAGEPFAVYHSHQSRRGLGNAPVGSIRMLVGPRMIVFNPTDLTGNVWLLEPKKGGGS